MDENDYEIFRKRYKKFKNNNLPTAFWDEKRQTLEYVYFSKECVKYKEVITKESTLQVERSLVEALADIAFVGFYYSFTSKYFMVSKDKTKMDFRIKLGHCHAHSFEEVVESLYDFPESFEVSKEEEQFYSNQELEYLKRVQKYLLFIGLKDLEDNKRPLDRYCNATQKKYENAYIYRLPTEEINDILTKKTDFIIKKWYPEFEAKEYQKHEFRVLIVDKDENFKIYIECTHDEEKKYNEVKEFDYKGLFSNNEKIIALHFKILEIF